MGCDIYVSQRKGKLWAEAKKLQIKVDSGITVGHPAVTVDESTIFFSSDQKGGYGGKDIWVVQKIKRNRWSEPMNLGPAINTSGDEMFPFIHADGTLYFASDGHIGMGGLDIYKSVPDSNLSFTSVINLKSPVNSPGDDFGMIIERKDEKKDVFVHFSAVKKSGLKSLKEGEQLTFEIENSDKGPSAINLQKVTDLHIVPNLRLVKKN